MFKRLAACGLLISALLGAAPALAKEGVEGVPRYQHIFVIVEENKDYDWIMDPAAAPHLADLARRYGSATQFFAEVHPSEGNYVALLGGDTFGIHDDDAFFCKPGPATPECLGADAPGYVDHTVHAPHLGAQLAAAGLSWKGYYEDIPEPGSLAVTADRAVGSSGRRIPLYASKHSGFLNFADVQSAPDRARRLVGFDQLDRDIASDSLPNFALIIPNQCNEMHGMFGPGLPAGCSAADRRALIARGDAYAGRLVERLMASRAWSGPGNMAIVITFDESGDSGREGCCGVTPGAVSNFGGGRIATVVITNHGPRGVKDDTPYSHYSLLRTIEDAFGIEEHIGHAADTGRGVRPMTRLFATKR